MNTVLPSPIRANLQPVAGVRKEIRRGLALPFIRYRAAAGSNAGDIRPGAGSPFPPRRLGRFSRGR